MIKLNKKMKNNKDDDKI